MVVAELQPQQVVESTEVEFHLTGGGFCDETRVGTHTFLVVRSESETRKEQLFKLKAGYEYRYKIKTTTTLLVNNIPIKSEGEFDGVYLLYQGYFIGSESRGDTINSIPRINGQGGASHGRISPIFEDIDDIPVKRSRKETLSRDRLLDSRRNLTKR